MSAFQLSRLLFTVPVLLAASVVLVPQISYGQLFGPAKFAVPLGADDREVSYVTEGGVDVKLDVYQKLNNELSTIEGGGHVRFSPEERERGFLAIRQFMTENGVMN